MAVVQHLLPRCARAKALTSVLSILALGGDQGAPSSATTSRRPPRLRMVTGTRTVMLADIRQPPSPAMPAIARTKLASPSSRSRMSAPAGLTSTRSTRLRTIRSCSAGNNSSHNGSSCSQRLARLSLGHVRALACAARHVPITTSGCRSSARTWSITAAFDLSGGNPPDRAAVVGTFQNRLGHIVSVGLPLRRVCVGDSALPSSPSRPRRSAGVWRRNSSRRGRAGWPA